MYSEDLEQLAMQVHACWAPLHSTACSVAAVQCTLAAVATYASMMTMHCCKLYLADSSMTSYALQTAARHSLQHPDRVPASSGISWQHAASD